MEMTAPRLRSAVRLCESICNGVQLCERSINCGGDSMLFGKWRDRNKEILKFILCNSFYRRPLALNTKRFVLINIIQFINLVGQDNPSQILINCHINICDYYPV